MMRNRTMIGSGSGRWSKAALLAATFSLVAACSYNPDAVDNVDVALFQYDAVRQMEPQGPAFNQGLRTGYLDYSDVMYDEWDLRDFSHFAFKAVDSAKGEAVLPDTMASRDLASGDVEELGAARARLMAALEQTGRKKAPEQSAKAQTAFDCWIERAEERQPAAAIGECKSGFDQAIAEVERTLATGADDTYLVFFAWDQVDLSPVALTVLDQVGQDFALGKTSQVRIAGHADRSGSEAYNDALSERRARAVAGALVGRGIPEWAMYVQWLGERQPRIATPDDTPEPQNRRVEIVFG